MSRAGRPEGRSAVVTRVCVNLKVVLLFHRRVRDFPKEFTAALMLQATTTYSCVTNHRIVKDETRRLNEPSRLPAHCWPGGEAVADGTAPRPDAARRNEDNTTTRPTQAGVALKR